MEGLENELWCRWSDRKDGEWALLILQPFCHFTYITVHSPILLLLYLCHSSFSNPTVASPISHFILQPFLLLLCHRLFTYVTWWAAHAAGTRRGTRCSSPLAWRCRVEERGWHEISAIRWDRGIWLFSIFIFAWNVGENQSIVNVTVEVKWCYLSYNGNVDSTTSCFYSGSVFQKWWFCYHNATSILHITVQFLVPTQ